MSGRNSAITSTMYSNKQTKIEHLYGHVKETIAHLNKKIRLISDKIQPLKVRKHENTVRDEYVNKINMFIKNTKSVESSLGKEAVEEFHSFIEWYDNISKKQKDLKPYQDSMLNEKDANEKYKEISDKIKIALSKEKRIKIEDAKNVTIKSDL